MAVYVSFVATHTDDYSTIIRGIMAKAKRKVNFTVNEDIVESARRVAEERGVSLSSLVEEFLSRLADSTEESPSGWLNLFHKKHGVSSKKERTDTELEKIRADLARKHT